ncbi:MAG: hypothetical protein HY858_00380 [Candidatus Solibacter usitatus]|nr:hypothetical protein [Candidatus Solibacter usitatus]
MVLLADIQFERTTNGRSRRRYLRIHGDETAAAKALAEHMRTRRGVAFSVTGSDRLVTVAGGRLDPNRMYSRAGAEKSYRRLNPGWSDLEVMRALDWLDGARPKLVKALLPPKRGLLFALHNNARGYSVEDEVGISQAASLPRRGEPHEFFLATDGRDYKLLSQGPYNVVLQSAPEGEDDGSMSRLCARLGVRYVNLEVGTGKLERQKEMMDWLEKALPE